MSPSIPVSLFLNNGVFLVHGLATFTHANFHRKIRVSGKGGINVNQVNLAGKAFQQAAHHKLVVAPDQLVAPALFKGGRLFAFPVIKQAEHFPQLYFLANSRLIHHLHNLKGIWARFLH